MKKFKVYYEESGSYKFKSHNFYEAESEEDAIEMMKNDIYDSENMYITCDEKDELDSEYMAVEVKSSQSQSS